MSAHAEVDSSESTAVLRMAEWVNDFAASPLSAEAAGRLRSILLDSISCGLAAIRDETVEKSLAVVKALGCGGACSIIGSPIKTNLPMASFANGVLIRALDLNDTYAGPRQIGHPSDNVGAALSATEHADRSGVDLLRAIRLCYEIYGRIQDIFDPEKTDWDHVTASGLAAAATTGWALSLPHGRLAHALALAATHAATLREVRGGSISAAKSIANAAVVENATLLTLLAAEGMTGPKFAIEGSRGFANVVLKENFDAFFAFDGTRERFLLASVKFFPCFALAQGPIAAALELRKQLPAPIGEAEKITVELADSQPARLRLGDPAGKMPRSHEAADHSIHYLVTMALLEGRISVEQFDQERWLDDAVRAVMSRIEAKISSDFPPGPQKAFPCRITARFGDGSRHTVERLISPGHPAAQVAFAEVRDKFHSCAAGVLDDAAQHEIIKMIEDIEGLRSVRPLMKLLAAPGT